MSASAVASLLFVFDFDRTLLDGSAFRVVFSKQVEAYEADHPSDKRHWIEATNPYLRDMTESQIRQAVRDTLGPVVDPKIIKMLERLGELADSETSGIAVEIAVVSDNVDTVIDEFFAAFVPAMKVKPMICTNTMTFGADGCVVVPQMSHQCEQCNNDGFPNQCKSTTIVEDLLKSSKLVDPCIIFAGDGSNDFCVPTNQLRPRDILLARRGFALERLIKQNGAGVSRVAWWDTQAELSALVDSAVESAIRSGQPANPTSTVAHLGGLPPFYLFHDGSDTEFRAVTLATRMPQLVRRTRDHNKDALPVANQELLEALAVSTETNGSLDVFFGESVAHIAGSEVASELQRSFFSAWATNFTGKTAKTALEQTILKWGDLPWLHGEVAFNLLLVHLCHVIPASEQRKEEDASSSADVLDATPYALTSPLLVGQGSKLLRRPFDVYAPEKANSVTAFLTSHIIPMTAKGSATDWRKKESLAAILEQSLWGNAVDLSMFRLSQLQEQHHGEQGSPASPVGSDASRAANLVHDDFKAIAARLTQLLTSDVADKTSTGQRSVTIDIIQDNVGVENAADLLLALYLLQHCDRSRVELRVRLHVKPLPHYVSDTMPHDLRNLTKAVRQYSDEHKDNSGSEAADAREFADTLDSLFVDFGVDAECDDKQLPFTIGVYPDRFWVMGNEYRDMPPRVMEKFFTPAGAASGQEPRLVAKSDFVLVKGDLNFRRLVGDRHWDDGGRAVSLAEAIGDYWRFDLVPLAALRTLKSEVCVGLTKQRMEQLDASLDAAVWRVNGKFGIAALAAF